MLAMWPGSSTAKHGLAVGGPCDAGLLHAAFEGEVPLVGYPGFGVAVAGCRDWPVPVADHGGNGVQGVGVADAG